MPTTLLGLDSDDPDPLARRKRDRRLLGGCVAVAMFAFFTLDYLGQHLAAVGAYWLFVAVAAGVLYESDHAMDERDRQLEERTSYHAIQVVGAGLVALAPGLSALADAGIYDAPAVLDGVALGWGVVFVVWGVAYLWNRSQA